MSSTLDVLQVKWPFVRQMHANPLHPVTQQVWKTVQRATDTIQLSGPQSTALLGTSIKDGRIQGRRSNQLQSARWYDTC